MFFHLFWGGFPFKVHPPPTKKDGCWFLAPWPLGLAKASGRCISAVITAYEAEGWVLNG